MQIHVGWVNEQNYAVANTTCTNVVQACDVLHAMCQSKYNADPNVSGYGEVRLVGTNGKFRILCQSDTSRYI